MDREIWRTVMAAVRKAARAAEAEHPPTRKALYPNWLIVAMYLWGVWHDRCLSWCCDRGHYGGVFRPRGTLPSVSQFTRRVKADACRDILQRVHRELAACGVASRTGYFDGKPLPVGPCSKDPDAARGHVPGGFAKGYKLHAYVNEHRRVAVWSVMPLNWAEQAVAQELAGHLPPAASPDALDLADSNYDAAPLHKAIEPLGRALLTPVKAARNAGPAGAADGSRHPKTLRQMGPGRREVLAAWARHPDLARHVLGARNNVEGVFSVLTVACGLGPALPAHVRRLGRVRRWVGAKIILYHARLLAREASAKAVA